MPLLVHATGWWLVGLLVGAWLGDASWMSRRAATPAWSPLSMIISALLIAPIVVTSRRRFGAGVLTAAAVVGIALAGVLASLSATDRARRCRAAAVDRLAHGARLSLVFDGPLAGRATAPHFAPRRA